MMDTIDQQVALGQVRGTFDPAFGEVAAEFVRNFAERDEVGAALCIHHDGRCVVDLWGGVADRATGRAWEDDTVVVVFSCTKAATALCAHVLVDRGLLDLEAPVREYWPEFARGGKESATVRMMLDHSVGVPVFRDKVRDGGFYDWDHMVERLEAEPAFWEPGTRNGYHMVNFGWTVGELVRRVSGRSLGRFFGDEIAEPLGLDFWIGLPEEIEPRVAPIIPFVRRKGDPLGEFALAVVTDPASIPSLSLANQANLRIDSRAGHAAEIGGGGGLASARGLGSMYVPLAAGGSSLVSNATLERMRRVSVATNRDATLLIPTRFALGFMVSMDNRGHHGDKDSAIIGESAFGHVGAGGSIGFADPSCDLAFGYVMNRMGNGILLNERGQSLVDATYRSLGFRTCVGGAWVR